MTTPASPGGSERPSLRDVEMQMRRLVTNYTAMRLYMVPLRQVEVWADLLDALLSAAPAPPETAQESAERERDEAVVLLRKWRDYMLVHGFGAVVRRLKRGLVRIVRGRNWPRVGSRN